MCRPECPECPNLKRSAGLSSASEPSTNVQERSMQLGRPVIATWPASRSRDSLQPDRPMHLAHSLPQRERPGTLLLIPFGVFFPFPIRILQDNSKRIPQDSNCHYAATIRNLEKTPPLDVGVIQKNKGHGEGRWLHLCNSDSRKHYGDSGNRARP